MTERDEQNTHGVADDGADVEADTASGGAPERPDESHGDDEVKRDEKPAERA